MAFVTDALNAPYCQAALIEPGHGRGHHPAEKVPIGIIFQQLQLALLFLPG
jgi:hypothetical protein